MRAIYSLTTPQGRKDTPSLIDVKGVDRPTEFTGKEEDFQQRSTKHGSVLFLGDQGVRDHVGHGHVELEFTPSTTNVERCVLHSVFVLQQMLCAFTALTRYAANDIVANSRKNPLEALRRLQK